MGEPPLEALPAPSLLRLTVAATKSGAVAEGSLDAVASAAAMTLPGWNMEDVSKLLLAVAKAKPRKSRDGRDGVADLYKRAYEVLPMKLSDFSSVQLIKVLLAISQAAECRPLMEAVALHARVGAGHDCQITLNVYCHVLQPRVNVLVLAHSGCIVHHAAEEGRTPTVC